MTVVIARTANDNYELRVDGAAVKTYSQSQMRHPADWIADAVANGADGWAISSGEWEYKDER